VDGKSKELSTKRKWESCKWNANKGRAIGNSESVKELNNFIDEFERTVYQAKRFLMESNKEITAQAVKNVLTGNYEKKRMILEIFRHHNDQMKEPKGIDMQRAPSGGMRFHSGISKQS
jgi:hypothetical protein